MTSGGRRTGGRSITFDLIDTRQDSSMGYCWEDIANGINRSSYEGTIGSALAVAVWLVCAEFASRFDSCSADITVHTVLKP